MGEEGGPRFLTVDLEVWSKEDLAPLARALEGRSFVLHVGRVNGMFLASFESDGESPEETIWRLLDLIKPLRGRAKRLWESAEQRKFDIGFECGDAITLFYETLRGSGCWSPRDGVNLRACETSLGPEVLRAVADVRGTLAMTIYPPRKG